jgi:hypothetical protein
MGVHVMARINSFACQAMVLDLAVMSRYTDSTMNLVLKGEY